MTANDMPGLSADQKQEVNAQLDKARKDVIGGLTPWIPGDFVVVYGALLTTWSTMKDSFWWMLVVAAASAIVFVVLGAFAAAPAKTGVGKSLLIRTVVGFLVSVYASIAIPNSGWWGIEKLSGHELQVTVTAGLLVVIPVMILTGLEKRGLLPAQQ